MNYEKMTRAELITEIKSLNSRLKIAGFTGKATDITRYRRLEKELATRVQRQDVIAYLGHKALRGGDMTSLMNEVVKKVAETLDNEYCKILELLPDGKELLLKAGVGWKKGLVGRATVPAELDSQAGYTLQSRKPVIVDDLKTETRFSGPPLLCEHNVVSGMCVIIQGKDSIWGVLGTHTTRHTFYNEDDINFLQAVANLLADVIARKEAEEELKESEEKYRLLVESANDAIFVADAETGIIIDANKRAEQMIGLPAEKIVGMHQASLHPPEEAEHYKKIFEDHVNSGRAVSKGIFVCNKDGRKIPVEISASITELKGRKIIQGIFRDITERRRREEVLQFSQFAVDNNADATYWVKSDAKISYANKAACQSLEYSYEELISLRVHDIDPDFPIESWPAHWQKMKEAGTLTFEAHHKTKARLVFPVEIQSTYLEYDGQEYICAFVRNITERKKTEERLQEQKKVLEQKNIALSEILGQIEIEKKQIKDNVIANAENLLLPVIQKLRLKGESRKYVQLLRKNLQELTSSFGARLTGKETRLTSREIEICNMIKNGLTSKEIASLSNISLRTAEKHRINIRRKLGIIKKDINLASFLKTF